MACDISRATRALPSVMRCRRTENGVRPLRMIVDFLEATQKAGQHTGTNSDVCADLHIALA